MLTPNDLYNKIIYHLYYKIPFSHIRVGDGEAKFLHFSKNSKESVFIQNKQINREITDSEYTYIKEKLSAAISKADILGVPSELESKKSDWVYVYPVLNELKKREDWICEKYCNMWSNRHLLERGYISKILKRINSVVLISGRDVTDALKLKYKNIIEIEYYDIPPEQRFEKEKNTKIDTLGLFEEISKKIKQKNRKGQLLLYGTGFFGKYLGQTFKECGGVAVDIGSVFDIFAGIANRGWAINLVKRNKL
jgi:hypothetical protein